MAYIKTMLKKFFGNMDDVSNEEEHIYPVTATEAVFDKNNNTLDSIITSLKTSIKNNNTNIKHLQNTINNLNTSNSSSSWNGNIVENFNDMLNVDDTYVITTINNDAAEFIVWDTAKNRFLNRRNNNGVYRYYTNWMGKDRYMNDNNIPHNKLFKLGSTIFYYNIDTNKMMELNEEVYLPIFGILETAAVSWWKYPRDGEEPLLETYNSEDIVYIKTPSNSENWEYQFDGPVFAYIVDVNTYYIPYTYFNDSILSKYQSKEGVIKEGLKVDLSGQKYQYNSNTKTLERV